ncbi:MAG: hypothetical protein IKG01_08230 [Lachnospiraceae bacterium]|nr:hypothetical protein [Lachnospiraceae bacterium]
MFTITLYRMSKKPNSTARPSGGSTVVTQQTSFSCLVRTPSSVMTPVVILQDPNDQILNYNYAYIPTWHRYYFIDDITMTEGNHMYEVSMHVDVLATYQRDIMNSTQYVLRSASDSDGTIVDHYYPTKDRTDFDYKVLSVEYNGNTFDCKDIVGNMYLTKYFKRSISEGEFVIGVIGENATGITYYVLDYSNFKTLLNNLMAFTPSNMSDVSTGIAKVLADPMQFITTCFWVPYAGQVSQTARSINFGYYSINCTAGVLNASDYAHFMTYADIPKHPQSSRGAYLNTTPFTSLTLLFNPFGALELDTTKLVSAERVRVEWYYDCTKGNAEIFVYNNDTGETAYHGYCDMMGVPIQLTQLTVNSIDTAVNAFGAVRSLFAFDPAGLFQGIGNAVESQMPKASRSGSEGSFLNYRSVSPRIIADFIYVVDEDLDNAGRPYCKKVQLSTLSGYCQTGNAELSADMATSGENETIMNMMNNGIILED